MNFSLKTPAKHLDHYSDSLKTPANSRSTNSKWDRVRPSESKWDQVSPSETKWDHVRPSESKWLKCLFLCFLMNNWNRVCMFQGMPDPKGPQRTPKGPPRTPKYRYSGTAVIFPYHCFHKYVCIIILMNNWNRVCMFQGMPPCLCDVAWQSLLMRRSVCILMRSLPANLRMHCIRWSNESTNQGINESMNRWIDESMIRWF